MVDDSKTPESGAGEPKPPKMKAEDNPWYLLATLYGVPKAGDDELIAKNRIAWNRYFAANLDEEARTKLFEEKRHPAEELTPFSPYELPEVAITFAERREASAKKLALPASNADIDFSNVDFEHDAFLTLYLFSGEASFEGAVFSDWADFDGATFSDYATFEGATFSGGADFSGAAFSGWAFFNGATFSGEAYFDGATFSGWAYFDGATFSGEAYFRTATFGGESIFVNAAMKGETSFGGAKFLTEPPKFFNAKLHQGTIWRGIVWPRPRHADKAGTFIDAYACLKLEMDRLKKHEDELDFFARELQSRRVYLGPWRGLPFALYGALSDYGRSYLRPLVGLFYLALIGALAFLPSETLSPLQSLGVSAANSLNVFGFRKDFFDASTIESLPAALKVIAAVQTILGAILLFLFGLGIRNKFRMK